MKCWPCARYRIQPPTAHAAGRGYGRVGQQQLTQRRPLWRLDVELEVPSHTLEMVVTDWVARTRREAPFVNLNTITTAFEDILGPENFTRKQPRFRKDGKRESLPTVRQFPTRGRQSLPPTVGVC